MEPSSDSWELDCPGLHDGVSHRWVFCLFKLGAGAMKRLTLAAVWFRRKSLLGWDCNHCVSVTGHLGP